MIKMAYLTTWHWLTPLWREAFHDPGLSYSGLSIQSSLLGFPKYFLLFSFSKTRTLVLVFEFGWCCATSWRYWRGCLANWARYRNYLLEACSLTLGWCSPLWQYYSWASGYPPPPHWPRPAQSSSLAPWGHLPPSPLQLYSDPHFLPLLLLGDDLNILS